MNRDDCPRGQASLPALALALLVLSSVTVLSLAVADGALSAADREPGERHAASSVADRLVDGGGPFSVRQNVLNGSALDDLNASVLGRQTATLEDDDAVRISIADRAVVTTGDASGGTTIRRIVAVQRTELRSITPPVGPNKAITLPRRSDELTLALDPPNATRIHTITANDRVLLRNTSGLSGEYAVELSRFQTVRLRLVGPGPLHEGNLTLTYPVERTNRAVLAVTVDG